MRGIAGALLCTLLVGIQVVNSRNVEARAYGTSVFIGDDVYTVSTREQNIMISKGNKTVCEKNLNAQNFYMVSKIQAIVLDNNHIVFWGQHSLRISFPNNTVTHVVGIADINSCKIELKYLAEHIPSGEEAVDAVVLGNKDTYDVFLPSQKCNPCRYNRDGTEKNAPQFPQIQTGIQKGFHIHQFVDLEGVLLGYFFAYNLPSGGSVIKILDSSLKLQREMSFGHNIDIAATNYGIRPFMGICWKESKSSDPKLICETLDENLKVPKTFVPQSFPLNIGYTAEPQLTIDNHGELYVLLPTRKESEKVPTPLNVYRVDAYNGNLVENSVFKVIGYEYLDLKSYVRDDSMLCLVTVFNKEFSSDISTEKICKPFRKIHPLYP